MSSQKGFTLIEIIVSVAILTFILSLGLIISLDFFRGFSFRSEENTIVSVLQKARSQSMNNINQTRHGVHFDDPLKYIIFECDSSEPQCMSYADADTSKDITLEPSYGSVVTGTPFDVVFEQLNGNCVTSNCSTSLTITATDSGKSRNIVINNLGRIDWQ